MALMSSPLSAVLASVPREALAKDTVQQKSLSAFQSTNQSQAELVASSAGIQAASDRPNGDPIGDGSDQLYSQQLEQRLAKELAIDRDIPSFQSLFGIPLRGADYKRTRQNLILSTVIT